MRPDHNCPLPAPVADLEDRHCPECGSWWTVEEDYCGECGRSEGPVWQRIPSPRQGPALADGEHWRYPPPPLLPFPMVSVRRGGLIFGAAPPPPPSWLERDAQIKAEYAQAIKDSRRIGIAFDEGASMAGGWCAPTEVIYELGEGR